MAAPFPAQRPATPDCCVMPRAVFTASVIVKLCDFDVMNISLTRSMGASSVFPTAPAAAPHASNSTDVSRSRIWRTGLSREAALSPAIQRHSHDGLAGNAPCVRCGSTARHARLMPLGGVQPCPHWPKPPRKGPIAPRALPAQLRASVLLAPCRHRLPIRRLLLCSSACASDAIRARSRPWNFPVTISMHDEQTGYRIERS